MTFGLSGQGGVVFLIFLLAFSYSFLVFSYLAKAAFAQDHQEVEVVDSHFDPGGAHVVHGGAGQNGGRGHGCGKGLAQRHGQDGLRQGGRRRAIRLRLLMKMEGWRAECNTRTQTY